MYKTNYKIFKDAEVEFYSMSEPASIEELDIEIEAPIELWDKFRSGEILVDPVDIGCDKGDVESLDNNEIFYNAADCENDFEEHGRGRFENVYGEGVLYGFDNVYLEFRSMKRNHETEIVRVTVK